MVHPESKSAPTFSDFPLLLAPRDREFFKTEDHRLQKVGPLGGCDCADLFSYGSFVLNKVLGAIGSSEVSQNGPRTMLGPQKSAKNFFRSQFWGFCGDFTGIVQIAKVHRFGGSRGQIWNFGKISYPSRDFGKTIFRPLAARGRRKPPNFITDLESPIRGTIGSCRTNTGETHVFLQRIFEFWYMLKMAHFGPQLYLWNG